MLARACEGGNKGNKGKSCIAGTNYAAKLFQKLRPLLYKRAELDLRSTKEITTYTTGGWVDVCLGIENGLRDC